MKPRINWTDQQWAMYLDVNIKNLPRIRNLVNENYSAMIVIDKKTSNRAVAIYRYEITPSGFKRPILMATSKKTFNETDDAVKYANEEFLPNLVLTEYWSRTLGVPDRALQMLSIKER